MKMIRKHSLFAIIASTLVLVGCKKDFDSPPINVLPAGNIITIDSLRKIFSSFDSTFVNDISVYGTVTADEISGNLYKVIYIQDETNGIQLDLTASSDKLFFEGDRVRLSLKGTTITGGFTSSGAPINMITITNVNPDINLIKQSKGNSINPKVVSITDLYLGTGTFSPYQGQLVQINDVEFICDDIFGSYADPINQYDVNKTLNDTLGNTVLVRSSGYSNFAGTSVAKGKGTIIAIVSQYRTDVQLTLRKLSDVSLNGTRNEVCPYVLKDFDDQSLTSGGWTTKLITGPVSCAWGIYAATNSAGKVSNYDPITSSNVVSESWLISPSMNLSGATNPNLSFRNVVRYSVIPKLEVLVSTNYDGISNPNTATWTDLTGLATWDNDPSTWSSWTSSGNINLSTYKQPSVYVAYRLIGNTSNASTWEIDDVMVKDI